MADPRGGLGSFARNGNSSARTYGAGIRPPSRDPGTGRGAGSITTRARAGVVNGRAAVTGSATAAAAVTAASTGAATVRSGVRSSSGGGAVYRTKSEIPKL